MVREKTVDGHDGLKEEEKIDVFSGTVKYSEPKTM